MGIERYRCIPLTNWFRAIVEQEDYDDLVNHKWCAMPGTAPGRWLAARGITLKDGRHRLEYMSRRIMGLEFGDPLTVDHRNHVTLDNRRSNLRILPHGDNNQNQRSRGGSSRFVGVTYDRDRQKWRAQIQYKGKMFNLGRFDSELAAASERDRVVEEWGSLHQLNLGNN